MSIAKSLINYIQNSLDILIAYVLKMGIFSEWSTIQESQNP